LDGKDDGDAEGEGEGEGSPDADADAVLAVVEVVVVVCGGRASDAVEESTGVAMEEESAGEDGVAAAAAPNPNLARGGRSASLSFVTGAAADCCCCCCCCCCLGRGVLVGPGGTARILGPVSASTIDVIGFTGAGAQGRRLFWADNTLVCTGLALLPLCFKLAGMMACLGLGVGVVAPEADAEAEPAPESADLAAASVHMAVTAVTRPPRPPRADLTSYLTSS
jgi:hypothetical protein